MNSFTCVFSQVSIFVQARLSSMGKLLAASPTQPRQDGQPHNTDAHKADCRLLFRRSEMLSIRNWGQFSLVVFALLIFSPRSSAQTISCSSDDGHRHYCSVNGPGQVQLVKRRSDSPCQQGYSWGSDGGGIWVDHGCRADFAVVPYPYGGPDQGNTISCSSDDGHRHYCSADTRGGVRLLKQRSDSPCQQGHSWGFDRRRIWVDHGCRADFLVAR